MMTWLGLDPRFDPEALGYLPSFLSDADPRPAREQLDENYQHGGGWRPTPGFKLDPRTLTLRFPGDPPYKPLAMTILHGDRIVFLEHELVMILKPDDKFEVCRMT